MFRFRCTVISPSLRRVTLEPSNGCLAASPIAFFPKMAMSTSSQAAFRAATGISSASLTSISNNTSSNTQQQQHQQEVIRNMTSSSSSRRTTTASFSKVFQTKNLPTAFKRPFVFVVPQISGGGLQQMRFSSTAGGTDKADEGKKTEKDDEKKTEGDEKAKDGSEEEKDGEKKDKDGKDKKPEKEKGPGFLSNFTGFKEDLTKHPDVYNVPNMMNLLLFSLFCLASTGSNTEADWWVSQWGIDGAFKPWTWPLHSWMTNNLPPMAFGMMLIHSMAHSVVAGHLGNAGLLRYVAAVSVLSGFSMWAYNAAIGQRGGERQFGPWDVCAGLFVMQYLHQGITPFVVLSGFQSWLRYASFVGAICTLYYNPQPTVCGTIIGLVLCKTAFKAPLIKVAPTP